MGMGEIGPGGHSRRGIQVETDGVAGARGAEVKRTTRMACQQRGKGQPWCECLGRMAALPGDAPESDEDTGGVVQVGTPGHVGRAR